MKKIDTLIKILYDIYYLLKNYPLNPAAGFTGYPDEEQMTRQEVKDYLKISESTYKCKSQTKNKTQPSFWLYGLLVVLIAVLVWRLWSKC